MTFGRTIPALPVRDGRIEVDYADAVHAEMVETGVLHGTMGDGPQVTPWGTKDVHVLDADRNLLTFFAPA